MDYFYTGKHSKYKQNVFFNRATALMLVAVTTASTFGVFELAKQSKEEEPKTASEILPIVSSTPMPDAISRIEEIESLYDYVNMLDNNTRKLIFMYIRQQLTENGMNLEEIIYDKDFHDKSMAYVESYRDEEITLVDSSNKIDTNNIYAVLNDNKILNDIWLNARRFGFDPGILIAIAAANSDNGILKYGNALGVSGTWFRLESSMTVYDLDNNCLVSIGEKSNEVEDGAKALASSLKQTSGDLHKALIYYYIGYRNPSAIVDEDTLREAYKFANMVEQYIMMYYNDMDCTVDYYYTISESPRLMSARFRSDSYDKFYDSIFNDICSNLQSYESSNKNGRGL